MSCSDCEKPGLIEDTLIQSGKFLHTAHTTMAELYRNLAQKTAPTNGKQMFLDAADSHDRMAADSLKVVVPSEGDLTLSGETNG